MTYRRDTEARYDADPEHRTRVDRRLWPCDDDLPRLTAERHRDELIREAELRRVAWNGARHD
jgi:hypothetical protein